MNVKELIGQDVNHNISLAIDLLLDDMLCEIARQALARSLRIGYDVMEFKGD